MLAVMDRILAMLSFLFFSFLFLFFLKKFLMKLYVEDGIAGYANF